MQGENSPAKGRKDYNKHRNCQACNWVVVRVMKKQTQTENKTRRSRNKRPLPGPIPTTQAGENLDQARAATNPSREY